MKGYLELIWTFVKIGASTFGGGYAMVPVLDRELIRGRGWITMDEIMDYYTVAQVTPGIIAVNVSTFVGYKRKGLLGGVLATAGFILPGISLMILVSLFISRFAQYPAAQHAFAGIRIAVGALILDTVIKLLQGFYKNRISMAIFAAAFALAAVLGVSPAAVVLGAGLLGWLHWFFCRVKSCPAEYTKASRRGNGETGGTDSGTVPPEKNTTTKGGA
ncbi:MAG: chromate transporter [Treponema sp.]|jgi:chromate transporter|nr:chromate transporter [Treponema sp.]